MSEKNVRTGLIGGTGLYKIEGMEILERAEVQTPFGPPSAPLTRGKIGGQDVVFLPRHGENHSIMPSEINFRANIWALKSWGVRNVISISATGSLREQIEPGHLSIPDQYFDWTRGRRAASFFGGGTVAHISTAQPSSTELADWIFAAASASGVRVHRRQTYACVEGPRLGTRAESFFLRGAGCDLVGMTNVPEVFLACEARLNYCTIAIVTDYDCWQDDPAQHVSVERVIARYGESLTEVRAVLQSLFESDYTAACVSRREPIAPAVLTPRDALTAEQNQRLEFLDS